MKKIVCITGTRPQLVKHSVLIKALKTHFEVASLYTSQHYQYELNGLLRKDLFSEETFYDLTLANDISLANRLADMLKGIANYIDLQLPQAVLVYGDTDSTLAGALAANKMKVPLIHIEAGERSFNISMPEETNRILTDSLASILFCVSNVALNNLQKERNRGIAIVSGDIMKDLLLQTACKFKKPILDESYFYCTIHRDYNKNNTVKLLQLINALTKLNARVIFPTHPATLKTIETLGLNIEGNRYGNIHFLLPLSYCENIHYQKFAKAIITDSGGIQKEAYWLGVPCFTYRKETEWVETLEGKWNRLVYEDIDNVHVMLQDPPGDYNEKLYGNGQASNLITQELLQLI